MRIHHLNTGTILKLMVIVTSTILFYGSCTSRDGATSDQQTLSPLPESLSTSTVLASIETPTIPAIVLQSFAFPSEIDPSKRYLFYLHGKIVEDQGLTAISPDFGEYLYSDILDALSDSTTHVISEMRSEGADPVQSAEHVADQVQALLAYGVPPEHITVAGFSKGGAIAMLASSLLQNDEIHFVFLGGCVEEVLAEKSFTVAGQVLSIYEASDDFATSCQQLFDRSSAASIFEEIRLETGLGHGAFYAPAEEWIGPLLLWARSEYFEP